MKSPMLWVEGEYTGYCKRWKPADSLSLIIRRLPVRVQPPPPSLSPSKRTKKSAFMILRRQKLFDAHKCRPVLMPVSSGNRTQR